jgi:hypothetical protein
MIRMRTLKAGGEALEPEGNVYSAILHYVLKVNALKPIIGGLDSRIPSITFGSEACYLKFRPAIQSGGLNFRIGTGVHPISP